MRNCNRWPKPKRWRKPTSGRKSECGPTPEVTGELAIAKELDLTVEYMDEV
jgi:hypothetical protein